MLKIIENHIKKYGKNPMTKNRFIGSFVSEDGTAIQLFYALTRGQRYSTHKKAACKKFYEIAKKDGITSYGRYFLSTSFDYEEHAHNLISYNFTSEN